MMPMSPTDAQIILVGVKENGSHLSIGYRRALETIAGMNEEYRAERQVDGGTWLPICGWYDHDTAQFFADMDGYATRIVRRYATTPEEA